MKAVKDTSSINLMISGRRVRVIYKLQKVLSAIIDEAGRMLRRRDLSDVQHEATGHSIGDINLETMDMPLRECANASTLSYASKHRRSGG
jgi:DNA-binding winged helix-turn-helix (wHTH) protein